MTPVIQGWCPGALRPMRSGDGLVVRVRPHGGRLSRAQAAGIAALSAQRGNGLIDLSARANVQLRGVRDDSHAALIEGLDALGLIDRSAQAEAARNIVVTPFWQAGDAAPRLAAAIEAALAEAPALPGKFGYAVDTAPQRHLAGVSADIRLEQGRNGGLILRADGADLGLPVTEDEAPRRLLDLARWFVATGGAPGGRGRMAAHLTRVALPAELAGTVAPADEAAPAHPGPVAQGMLVGFAFGQITAETLAALAQLGDLRVTPWRMLLVEGAGALPDLPGAITDPDDPLLRIIACTGAPGCPQALHPTRPLARAAAPLLPKGQLLHVSGCAKGCAHPGAGLTLVAEPAGFGLIPQGRANDAPKARAADPESTLTLLKKALSNALDL